MCHWPEKHKFYENADVCVKVTIVIHCKMLKFHKFQNIKCDKMSEGSLNVYTSALINQILTNFCLLSHGL